MIIYIVFLIFGNVGLSIRHRSFSKLNIFHLRYFRVVELGSEKTMAIGLAKGRFFKILINGLLAIGDTYLNPEDFYNYSHQTTQSSLNTI